MLAFCGFSGSGKTTLLEEVIARLLERHLRVAVIKHDAHGVDLDRSGKDSDRLFRAGAEVMLRGPNEVAARWHANRAPSLHDAAATLVRDHDIVLVEGHKSTPLAKIWLCRQDDGEPPPDIAGIRAVLPWESDRVGRAMAAVTEFLDEVWRTRPVCGGILVGGRSDRMARPKQLLEMADQTFAEIVAREIDGFVERTVMLGSGPLPPALEHTPQLPDPPGLHGPIAGLITALRWNPRSAWLIVACDQPMVRSAAVDWLLSHRRPGCWAVMPKSRRAVVEPFLAVYEPQALSLLERNLADRWTAPRSLAGHPKVECPEPPRELEDCWRSINTPADYEALGE